MSSFQPTNGQNDDDVVPQKFMDGDETSIVPPPSHEHQQEEDYEWFRIAWISSTQSSNATTENKDTRSYSSDTGESASSLLKPLYYYYGCLAKMDIPKHTLIHIERSALYGDDIWQAMQYETEGIMATQAEDDAYLAGGHPSHDPSGDANCRAILSPDQRIKLWQLHDQRNVKTDPHGDSEQALDAEQPLSHKRLMGIIYSNSFCNSDFGMEPSLWVGPTSRFNHSCAPNLGVDFDGHKIRFFTSRPVQAGEELCLSYNDVIYMHSSKVRQSFLYSKYKFHCQCCACLRSGSNGRHSDIRRRHIGLLGHYLSDLLPGACFLYNDTFESKIRKIQKEGPYPSSASLPTLAGVSTDSNSTVANQEDVAGIFELDYGSCVSITKLFGVYLEYMSLLEREGLDHDMLDCFQLAYEIASEQIPSKAFPLTPPAGLAPLASTTCNEQSYNPWNCTNFWEWTPSTWGAKTLALLRIHKGEHHTWTKAFEAKLHANGHF